MKRVVGLALALTLLATAASGKTDFYDLLKNRNVMVAAVALLLVRVPPRCPNNPPSPPGDMITEFIIMLGHENDAASKRDVTVQITRLVNEWDDDPPGMNRRCVSTRGESTTTCTMSATSLRNGSGKKDIENSWA
jgi:hypothetical protein